MFDQLFSWSLAMPYMRSPANSYSLCPSWVVLFHFVHKEKKIINASEVDSRNYFKENVIYVCMWVYMYSHIHTHIIQNKLSVMPDPFTTLGWGWGGGIYLFIN